MLLDRQIDTYIHAGIGTDWDREGYYFLFCFELVQGVSILLSLGLIGYLVLLFLWTKLGHSFRLSISYHSYRFIFLSVIYVMGYVLLC